MWTLKFFSSFKGIAPLFLRAAIGYSFFWVHGKDKLLSGEGFGTFDWGKDFVASVPKFMTDTPPAWMLYTAAWTEFLAGAALLLGLLTRWASVGLLAVMAYAIFKVHGADPYLKKELAIGYAAALSALLTLGAGPMSVDRLLLGTAGGGD